MARNVSLTTLIDYVRKRADIENETLRFPDLELTDYINQSITELYELLVAADEEYYLSSQIITTVSGTSTYALSADFFKLKGVDINLGNGVLLTAKPYMFAERNMYQNPYAVWAWNARVAYRARGNNVTFIPAASGIFTATIWYIPTPTKLVAGSDTFDGVDGWDELVVTDVAIKCGIKDQIPPEDMQVIMGRKAELVARITSMAERDIGAPQRIVDVTSINDSWPYRGGIGGF